MAHGLISPDAALVYVVVFLVLGLLLGLMLIARIWVMTNDIAKIKELLEATLEKGSADKTL